MLRAEAWVDPETGKGVRQSVCGWEVPQWGPDKNSRYEVWEQSLLEDAGDL